MAKKKLAETLKEDLARKQAEIDEQKRQKEAKRQEEQLKAFLARQKHLAELKEKALTKYVDGDLARCLKAIKDAVADNKSLVDVYLFGGNAGTDEYLIACYSADEVARILRTDEYGFTVTFVKTIYLQYNDSNPYAGEPPNWKSKFFDEQCDDSSQLLSGERKDYASRREITNKGSVVLRISL